MGAGEGQFKVTGTQVATENKGINDYLAFTAAVGHMLMIYTHRCLDSGNEALGWPVLLLGQGEQLIVWLLYYPIWNFRHYTGILPRCDNHVMAARVTAEDEVLLQCMKFRVVQN